MKFDISHWDDAYLTWNTTERDILKRLIVYQKTIVHDLEVTSAHGSSVWQEATSFIYARDTYLRNTFVIGRKLQPGNLQAPLNQSKGCFCW